MNPQKMEILLGADIGTSDSKVLVTTIDGRELGSVSAATSWVTHHGTFTDTDPDALVSTVIELLDRAVTQTREIVGPLVVAGIAVTGMGEAGVLLTPDDRPVFPIIAWFDPRGTVEINLFPQEVQDEFCGRTGLPFSSLATVAKLAWMRGQGVDLTGKRWLNVPEYVVYRLGGLAVGELSLVARTGLLDQDTEDLWPQALAAIGADRDLLSPRVLAGTPVGRAGDRHGSSIPASLVGAVLTVAGHDHPVAAVGCGVIGDDELFDSFGTAEALVRTVPGRLSVAARVRLADEGVDAIHHVLVGRRLLLGGTKAGLMLRRTLRMLGASAPDKRAELDEAACLLGDGGDNGGAMPGLEITGAANDDGILRITVTTDDVTPAALWVATIANSVDEANRCLALMENEVGPASAAVVAGGWTRMQSIRRAKIASLPNVRFSDRSQAGAFGAAMFAAHAVQQAKELSEAGDHSAEAVHRPTGPTAEFAAQFTQNLPTSNLPPAHPIHEEITV